MALHSSEPPLLLSSRLVALILLAPIPLFLSLLGLVVENLET